MKAWLLIPGMLLAACSAQPERPVTTLTHVDLQRFMGDWYVIACIPTFLEKDAYNAVESYRLDSDGTIATTFSFNKGAYDGPLKRYTPRGFVLDASNARWGMRFFWPLKSDYRISYLAADYSRTVIGREARDHAWIMARTPQISDADYEEMASFIRAEGYDAKQLVRVPQRGAR